MLCISTYVQYLEYETRILDNIPPVPTATHHRRQVRTSFFFNHACVDATGSIGLAIGGAMGETVFATNGARNMETNIPKTRSGSEVIQL